MIVDPMCTITRDGEVVDGDPAAFVAARPSLFGGAFVWPVMVATQAALQHNIATLAAFCAQRGLAFAPHGKTTMAPQLYRAQLDAGAWAITAATAQQVMLYRRFGVARILLANELLDATAVGWIAAEQDADPAFEFWCYVDSRAGVEAITRARAAAGASRPFRVLVEIGWQGGRTGCRTTEAARDVARAVAAADGVELAGVSGYEGGLPDELAVTSFLHRLRATTETLANEGFFDHTDAVVVSAGGSAWYDAVGDELGGQWLEGRTVHAVLRSGSYITHDDGLYAEAGAAARNHDLVPLRPALEVWAQVLSVPEAGRVIVGMGKRDAPYDEGLPIPLRARRASGEIAELDGARVTKVNDQHAYLAGDSAVGLQPGDVVCFGISHPCTAFDKWRLIPVVDADHAVVDLLRTHF